jgi:hypothetical protein
LISISAVRSAGLYLALLSVGCSSLVQAQEAGYVKTLQGQFQIERAGNRLDGRLGDMVESGDRIRVMPQSSVGISMKDETLVSLGPNSTFVIDQYAYDPTTREGRVETSILRGTLRYVTGLIGRANPKAITVNTPVSTLGIRGTDFIVEVPDAN